MIVMTVYTCEHCGRSSDKKGTIAACENKCRNELKNTSKNTKSFDEDK